jgi:hypothetical protein
MSQLRWRRIRPGAYELVGHGRRWAVIERAVLPWSSSWWWWSTIEFCGSNERVGRGFSLEHAKACVVAARAEKIRCETSGEVR